MDEIVLNYHVTEKCNYSCKYCFAKYGLEKRFDHELHNNPIYVAQLLKETYDYLRSYYNTRRIRLNLAGGEPLLISSISTIIDTAKDIGYELSIITNSSPLTKKFIEQHAVKFSIFGISIDSFRNETNLNIGRSTRSNRIIGNAEMRKNIRLIRDINPDIIIKINTVVSQFNYDEIMHAGINSINPDKWKIFKELSSSGSSIDDEAFNRFVKRNTDRVKCFVFVENNDDMPNSYLMIDPLGRFYQNHDGKSPYIYSDCILEVGVARALKKITFDINKFENRYIPIENRWKRYQSLK